MLAHHNLKSDKRYELCWRAALEAVGKAAYKAARSALLHLQHSDFESFKSLTTPDQPYGAPPFPIPHLAFISVKVFKGFQKFVSQAGMNHSHAPDWAAEALCLNQNYKASAANGGGRFIIFDLNRHYVQLTDEDQSRILQHSSLQLLPST